MNFDKYVAAGNDFIIFNGIEDPIEDYGSLALEVCHRQFGIGADGIMACENSSIADIKMIYYNSDGSQGEMCGNGIRSFSKYVYDHGIVDKPNFSVETLAGLKDITIEVDECNKAGLIKVDMGYPVFEGSVIPVKIDKDKIINEIITIDDKDYEFSALLVGVPHVVIFISNIDDININELGSKIENHPIFPKKTNVNFVEVIDLNNINIFTWERGAGRTLGCGTGSCGSVVVGNILNKLSNKVKVNTEGGKLDVEIDNDLKIIMAGDAVHIARGVLM